MRARRENQPAQRSCAGPGVAPSARMTWVLRVVLPLLLVASCEGPAGEPGNPGDPGEDGSDGQDGDQGPPGETPDAGTPDEPTDPLVLGPDEKRPGLVLAITNIAGGSGTNGNFMPGDTVSVTFTIATKAGTPVPLAALSRGGILVSGPTSGYQRVIPIVSDVKNVAVSNSDGSYTYKFATALPATYAAPYNDTASFGVDDGELTGQPLASGTYTVGMEAARPVIADGVTLNDAGNAVANFLVGSATTLDTRDVVAGAACNQCHERVQAHGGNRNDVRYCLTCHTAGSEDRNTATVANGTPGVQMSIVLRSIIGSRTPSPSSRSTPTARTRRPTAPKRSRTPNQ